MKYAIITFGCRVNQADSLGFEEELRARGALATAAENADLVVVNTCSVTASADQGARQTIRRLARENPHAHIVVTGCYATRCPDEVAALPNVARVLPNDSKPRLIQLLEPDFTTAGRFGTGDGHCGAAIEPGVAGRTAYTLRVQTGCAEACSYCIIPTTRGPSRSVPIEHVLQEVDRVVAAGFKEIALTGVHLGSYGRDLEPRSSLIELLGAVGHARESMLERRHRAGLGARGGTPKNDDLRFRISSLEPMDCTRQVVDLVAVSHRFAPHFHLPLQHASNRLLTAMGRPYTIEYYSALVDDIRVRIPEASIGSDVIVGFPGETDAAFEELLSYLGTSPLTHIHVFPYSDRPGTVASTMGAKVPGSIVRARARRVREIGQRRAKEFRESQIGAVHQGLTLGDGSLVVTGNYLKVRIPPGHPPNEWVHVLITSGAEPMHGEVR